MEISVDNKNGRITVIAQDAVDGFKLGKLVARVAPIAAPEEVDCELSATFSCREIVEAAIRD